MLYAETISNPGIAVADIPMLADIAHERGIPLVVDEFVSDTQTKGSSGAVCSSVYCVKLGQGVGAMGLEHGGIQVERVGELETKDATRHRIKWYWKETRNLGLR